MQGQKIQYFSLRQRNKVSWLNKHKDWFLSCQFPLNVEHYFSQYVSLHFDSKFVMAVIASKQLFAAKKTIKSYRKMKQTFKSLIMHKTDEGRSLVLHSDRWYDKTFHSWIFPFIPFSCQNPGFFCVVCMTILILCLLEFWGRRQMLPMKKKKLIMVWKQLSYMWIKSKACAHLVSTCVWVIWSQVDRCKCPLNKLRTQWDLIDQDSIRGGLGCIWPHPFINDYANVSSIILKDHQLSTCDWISQDVY